MAKKLKTVYRSYTENGERFMICRNSIEGGRYWKGNLCSHWSKVNIDTTATLCYRCVNRVTEPPVFTAKYTPTGRPKGWQWMNQFVDKDGTVYLKGKEQVELKGTLPVTVIKPKKLKKRLTKKKRESQNRELMAEIYKLKKQLKKVTLKKDKKSLEIQIRKLNRKIN
tara:strand:+ start:349 stop:849 length:501 start_codon:yes stop_codon:yes gene_type:complete